LEALLEEAKTTTTTTTTNKLHVLETLFVGLAYVRDIAGGRGERMLTYMMLDVWYQFFPVLAVYVLESILLMGYGSWRDIKGLCRYLRKHSIRNLLRFGESEHPLILTAVEFMVKHLDRPGVAKWVPRESSRKLQWLYDLFVFAKYGGAINTEKKRQFRLTVSSWTAVGVGTGTGAKGLQPRMRGAVEKWTGSDQKWKQWCKKQDFLSHLLTKNIQVVPVLYLSPEWLQKHLIRHAFMEILMMVEKQAVEKTLVILATVPPQKLWIDRNLGFSHNLQLLFDMLEQPSSSSFCNMNLEMAIQSISLKYSRRIIKPSGEFPSWACIFNLQPTHGLH
jgi:hypothetical protein